MASLPHSTDPNDEKARKKAMAERAARIAAMLARWETEDVSGEPDWSIDDIEPMTLRRDFP
ncbi:MAG: hypothetical protein E6J90_41145, partial [Deltaproteobacteria bacterium]